MGSQESLPKNTNNNVESQESLPNLTFYWNEKSSDEKNYNKWSPYGSDNQKLLNLKYQSYRKSNSQAIADLIGDFDSLYVDFDRKMQISKNKQDLRAIKIVVTSKIQDNNQINQSSNTLYKDDEIVFFWKSNKDPFDKNEEPEWSPYDLEDQKVLKDQFEIYLNDYSQNIANLKSLADNYVDFSSMYQISKLDSSRQRHVQRCHPKLVKNIHRINRFNDDNDDFNQTQMNFIKTTTIKYNIIQSLKHYKNEIFTIYFNVFETIISLKMESNMCFFQNNNIIDFPIQDMKNILVKEITDLGKLNGNIEYSIKKYCSDINNIVNEEQFFVQIVKLYTIEGYLFERLNRFLRTGHKMNIQLIKYYYTCLLFSFEYFSNQTLQKYSTIKEDLIVYRGSGFQDNELENELQQTKQNSLTLRVFKEFLSTSYDIDSAKKFLKQNDKLQYFIEIKIPKELIISEPSNFCDISNHSAFMHEKEI